MGGWKNTRKNVGKNIGRNIGKTREIGLDISKGGNIHNRERSVSKQRGSIKKGFMEKDIAWTI